MKIKKEISEALDNSRTDNYQKAEKAGGNVELTKKYLEAGERYMEDGAVIKRKGIKKYKKGIVALNRKGGKKSTFKTIKKSEDKKSETKNPKYFFGGMLGGLLGVSMIDKLRKKRLEGKDGEKKGGSEGKIMKVKVISDGSAEQVGKDDTMQASKEEQEKAEKMEEGSTGSGSGEGAVMKRGGIAKYAGGGTFFSTDSGKARPEPTKLDRDNVSIKSEEQKMAEKNVKKKGGTKVLSKGSQAAVRKGAPKMLGRVGSKFIPGVGWVALGADAGYLAMKQKAKGYAEMDKKSPGS